MSWQRLVLPKHEFNITAILRSGQAFRWRNINNVWSCALNNQIILIKEIPQLDTETQCVIEYLNIEPRNLKTTNSVDISKFIHDYFNLSISLLDLHSCWCKTDPYFPNSNVIEIKIEDQLISPPENVIQSTSILSSVFLPKGVRILSQDPWETLISFIISSNNNIKRISQLCEILCISYGDYLGSYNNVPYYTFPKPHEFFKVNLKNRRITTDQLNNLESELRSLGFGYRAKYIMKTVHKMIENPKLFEQLMNCKTSWTDDESCVQFLRQFDGVGPKVADCVALMGCHRHDLVPVDTHVWNVLRNRYRNEFNKWVDLLDDENPVSSKSILKKALSNKSVDVKIYPFVKQFFKDFWGLKAGWAQAVVFAGIVKLDNGINHIGDIEKLIRKVKDSHYSDDKDVDEPKVKRSKTK
jgi:N-glycosylase/DNA lyase